VDNAKPATSSSPPPTRSHSSSQPGRFGYWPGCLNAGAGRTPTARPTG